MLLINKNEPTYPAYNGNSYIGPAGSYEPLTCAVNAAMQETNTYVSNEVKIETGLEHYSTYCFIKNANVCCSQFSSLNE